MKTLITILACVFASALFSQSNIQQSVSVNSSGAAADASAQLDVSATDKGMLVPRMTTAQRTAIASPATGLLVFDVDTGGFWFYNGTAWTNLSTPKTLKDADGDTKIQVEESPDEDVIRFDLGGTENMALRKNASGITRLELPTTIENTYVGQSAGAANTSGSANTAIGREALFLNTTGFNNTALGGSALRSNISGNYNTAVGEDAMFANTTGTFNTAVGEDALRANNTGIHNTALGSSALVSNTTGNGNIAVGFYALYNNTIRNNLVAVGDSALYNNGTGVTQSFHAAQNTAIGSKSMFSNTIGTENTAVGYWSLFNNISGSYNTAIGKEALQNNTTGEENTSVGHRALSTNIGGDGNTAIGKFAIFSNNNGSNNTAIGHNADDDHDANNCVAVGASTDTGDQNNSYTNAIAIGYDANTAANNYARIGNTSVTSIGGQVNWSNYSDGRFKRQVQEDVLGLDFIKRLRPITYQWDIHALNRFISTTDSSTVWASKFDIEKIRFSGFIAQEVEQAAAETGYDFSGVDKPQNEHTPYALRYGEFVVPLVKAVQELEAENAALKSQLDRITAALAGAGIVVEK